MGIRNFHLVDPGLIEDVNVGPQQWLPADIGNAKVEALACELIPVNAEGEDHVLPHHSPISEAPAAVWSSDIFICTIDDMDQRKACFEKLQSLRRPEPHLFLDGRMSLWFGQVLSVPMDNRNARRSYEATLFPQSEADPTPCSARSTVFGSTIIGGLLVRQALQWLRSEPLELNYSINLLSLEINRHGDAHIP